MLNIVLFGPPGSGKGTQAGRLMAHYRLMHLSTGDIFRSNIQNNTELGRLAQSYMDKGELVPDAVTIRMLEQVVDEHPNALGFIFDGFPRTTAQAEALDRFLATKGRSVNLMLSLEVDKEELKRRILERGKISGRSDDRDPEIVEQRIVEYNNKTAPLKEYYQAQGKYHRVDGKLTMDQVFNALRTAIDHFNGHPEERETAKTIADAKASGTAGTGGRGEAVKIARKPGLAEGRERARREAEEKAAAEKAPAKKKLPAKKKAAPKKKAAKPAAPKKKAAAKKAAPAKKKTAPKKAKPGLKKKTVAKKKTAKRTPKKNLPPKAAPKKPAPKKRVTSPKAAGKAKDKAKRKGRPQPKKRGPSGGGSPKGKPAMKKAAKGKSAKRRN